VSGQKVSLWSCNNGQYGNCQALSRVFILVLIYPVSNCQNVHRNSKKKFYDNLYTYTGCGKKVSPTVFSPFSEQPFGIFTRNFAHILPVYIHVTFLKGMFKGIFKSLSFFCDKVINFFSVTTSLILMFTQFWQNETQSAYLRCRKTLLFEQHNKQFVNHF